MKLIIKEVAIREGIKNPLELSQKSGVPYASCYRLWNGETKMIAVETLERFCTLFKVWPNQLFDYTPEPEILPGPGEMSNERAKPARIKSPVRKGAGKRAVTVAMT